MSFSNIYVKVELKWWYKLLIKLFLFTRSYKLTKWYFEKHWSKGTRIKLVSK